MFTKKILVAAILSAFSLSCFANGDGENAGSCFASILVKLKKQLPVTQAQRSFAVENTPIFEKINKLRVGQCKGLSGTAANEPCYRKNLSSYEFNFYVGLGSTMLFIHSPQDPKNLPNLEVASVLCTGVVKSPPRVKF